ncbi:hypothetical protein HNY73_000942 [Argiope bruennichi]|uniref:Uncharacterized protein n=1 Tax=Argiope bruennichi TaxID=94029 RepID=A0A8T0G5S3_ARGBR|nr:hypothetical protein HNY73_000942 [Argiope bruennichi]
MEILTLLKDNHGRIWNLARSVYSVCICADVADQAAVVHDDFEDEDADDKGKMNVGGPVSLRRNSDEDEGSLNGDKACFQGGGNTTDSHEMSEAECDRDYHQHLRKNSHSPFVKFRIGPLTTNCGLCADNE